MLQKYHRKFQTDDENLEGTKLYTFILLLQGAAIIYGNGVVEWCKSEKFRAFKISPGSNALRSPPPWILPCNFAPLKFPCTQIFAPFRLAPTREPQIMIVPLDFLLWQIKCCMNFKTNAYTTYIRSPWQILDYPSSVWNFCCTFWHFVKTKYNRV